LALVATAVALVLAGCGTGSDAGRRGDPSAAAGSPAYPVTVGSVTLTSQPIRIVSLSPAETEMLFAIGAGAQVKAVDELSNHPPEAPKSDLSGFKPNAEAVAGKNPDLVVLTFDTNSIVDQLRKLKIPVYLAPAAKTVEDSYTQLTELGRLTGHASQAADVVSRMQRDIAALVAKVPQRGTPLRYYWELDPTFTSATSKTFIGSLLGRVGLVNVADPADAGGSAGGYPALSAESVVKANPDLIFLADTKCCQQSIDSVRTRPGWTELAAVRGGRVFPVDDDIASRWGPRVVELLRIVTEAMATVPA
jgi:iron complex transport system substrate-binding protein